MADGICVKTLGFLESYSLILLSTEAQELSI